MFRRVPILTATTLAAAVALLAGCGSSHQAAPAPSTTTPTTEQHRTTTTTTPAASGKHTDHPKGHSTTNTPAGHTTTAAKAVPLNVPNKVTDRQDVTMPSCTSAANGWSASGKITNTLGHAATYKITVFFTTKTATVVAYDTTSVPVKSGASRPWHVQAHFKAPKPTICVLRGVSTI